MATEKKNVDGSFTFPTFTWREKETENIAIK
jgi:hypothetical protein